MNTDTWVLVADSSRGRLFSAPEHRKPWTLIKEFTHAASRQTAGSLTSDQPGRTQSSASGGAHSAMESKTSPKEVEFIHFAHELAGVLHDGHGQQSYTRIVLVAPPHFLGLLRKSINPTVSKLIGATLDKDYMHLSQDDLHEHVDTLV
jgi:protein required for attachment to host cells